MSERAEQIKHYWEVGPNPTNPLNRALQYALEPWNFGSIGETKSHGWEWYRTEYPEGYQGNLVSGDKEAFPIQKGLLKIPSLLLMENQWFGWDQIRVIQPDQEQIDPDRKLEWWKYGWSPTDKRFLEICKINILTENPIKLMVGRSDFLVHGVGSDSGEVPLKVSDPIARSSARKDPLYKNIVLF